MDNLKNYDEVMKTLYIPLAARIYVSQYFPHFFYDEKAPFLRAYLPSLRKEKNQYFHFASVCRQLTIDNIIKNFLTQNPVSNIIFLGAGLDTAYDRIQNKSAYFYYVDLPEVIATRQKLLGADYNEKLIAEDMFTLNWVKKINPLRPTLVIVAGVFQYFKEPEIISFIKWLKMIFFHGEVVFDATNEKGLRLANKYIRANNHNAQMFFYVNDPQAFAQKTNTTLISTQGFFKVALTKASGLKLSTKLYMALADKLKRTLILHLALN